MENPSCGDEVVVRVRVVGGVVEALRFEGQGCAISQASAAMMARAVEGRRVEEVETLARRFGEMVRGESGTGGDPALGDLRALAGVAALPIRVRCALLAWQALAEALGARR